MVYVIGQRFGKPARLRKSAGSSKCKGYLCMIFSERLLHLWLFGLLREHLICCRKMRCFGIIFVIPHSLFLALWLSAYRNAYVRTDGTFVRGIGEATDVVSKEMFTVISGGNMTKLLKVDRLSRRVNFLFALKALLV